MFDFKIFGDTNHYITPIVEKMTCTLQRLRHAETRGRDARRGCGRRASWQCRAIALSRRSENHDPSVTRGTESTDHLRQAEAQNKTRFSFVNSVAMK